MKIKSVLRSWYIFLYRDVVYSLTVHHFAGDTNLLSLSDSSRKLNKLVNGDLKHLVNC